MNLEPTYGLKLNNGLIRLIQDEHGKGNLPLPMFKLRRKYLKRYSIDWSNLNNRQKEALRIRFSTAIDNLEGSYLQSIREPNGNGVPNRLIHFLKNPGQNESN